MGLSLTCLVDNTVQLSSRLWGEHGLSVLVEGPGIRVLFDTGQSGAVLAHNLEQLDVDLQGCSALVLSHGHYDHTGGLQEVLDRTGPLDLYAHPGVFEERYARRGDGTFKPVGMTMGQAELEGGARIHLSTDPQKVAPGVRTTGRIRRGAGAVPFDSHLVVRRGGGWIPDPIDDDLALVLETKRGLVVLAGCCHAGLVNTLAHVRQIWQAPVVALIGGSHLHPSEPAELQDAIDAVRDDFQLQRLVLGHCTGARAYSAFAQAMPEQVEPLYSGWRLRF